MATLRHARRRSARDASHRSQRPPSTRTTGICPERQRGDGPAGSRSHRSTVRRSSGSAPRSIAACASTRRRLVRPSLTISQADTGQRIPPAHARDLAGQAPLPIERPDELVHVDDIRLEFDDQQRAAARVPGEDVDHPAFAVDRERDLRREDPLGQLPQKPARDRLVKRECAPLSSRSRSPPRQRGTRSIRMSSAAPTARRLSIDCRPPARSQIADCETPDFASTSLCRQRRACRASRNTVPMRMSSTHESRGWPYPGLIGAAA